MGWEQLNAQPRVQRVLANEVNTNRIGHAYLFLGMPGSGTGAAARLFAQALNCTNEQKPCGICPSCKAMEKGVHPDVRVITPDGTSLKLAQIKEVTAEALITPNMGRYKIYIIEDAQAFTREAANALLLTLEEPAAFVVFILTANADVLATIESRCQVIRFGRPSRLAMRDQRLASVQLASDVLVRVLQAPPADRAKYAEQLDKDGVDLSKLFAGMLQIFQDRWNAEVTGERLPGAHHQVDVQMKNDASYLAATIDRIVQVQRMAAHNVNRRLLLETFFGAL